LQITLSGTNSFKQIFWFLSEFILNHHILYANFFLNDFNNLITKA